MSSIDDPDNDAWLEELIGTPASQEVDGTLPNTQREDISEEPVVVDASQVTNETPAVQTENRDADAQLQKDCDVARPKAKRNCYSFANRKLLASKEVFLDPLYEDQFDDPSVLLVGQVKECPREANGKRYRIEWKNEGKPLPAGLQIKWLQSYLLSTKENRMALQDAMTKYESCSRPSTAVPSMPAAGRSPRNQSKKKPRPTVAMAAEGAVSHIAQHPQTPVPRHVDALAASASVRTSSTISSLSQSTIASPEAAVARLPTGTVGARATRSTTDVESSSDDGDDLDEEDNMYVQQVEDVSDVSDEEEEEEEEPTTSNNSSGIGKMLEDIHWNFLQMSSVKDDDAPSSYNGPSGLKPGVAESFNDPFECLGVCGGLDYDLVCRLASNSNEYARKYLVKGDRNCRMHGQPFINITTEEMYHFLGITLRISLSPVDWGGYEAYFSPNNRQVFGVEIQGSDGFAHHYMTLTRYKQIRSAFHPEDRAAGLGGDKCYQLRHAINTLNAAAKNVKYIGENSTFDEGGIASWSRVNPVRQYNKDKPQKFRVDFFILACSVCYFIHHLDVYQGKNAANVGIHRAVRALPTTQKAVLNAVLATDMHREVNGARHIALDNRYQCPELALVLRQKFKIYSTGTCRKNRKGWDKDQMTLEKKEGRGKYKFVVDKDNKVVCCQWVDSKVVNCVSSILSLEVAEVSRQIGSEKKTFSCPYIITKYQKNMMGVDKSDQMRAAGGGFASKAHYKKWYKRAYFAILDMMTLLGLVTKEPCNCNGDYKGSLLQRVSHFDAFGGPIFWTISRLSTGFSCM
jgi:Transposase IS4